MTGRPALLLLPPSSAGRRLVAATVIDAVGTGLFLATATLFYTGAVGLSGAEVGLGIGIAGAAGFATTVPLAALGDRVGSVRLLVALQVVRAVAFALYAFIDSFATFVVGAALIACADAAAPPVTQAAVADCVDEEERVRTMAYLRSSRNLGFAAGALVAALVLTLSPGGYRALVLVDAASFLVAAGLLRPLVARSPRRAPHGPRGPRLPRRASPRYLGLTALCGVFALSDTILILAVPLWVTGHTDLPGSWVPPLIALNTVLVILLQVRLAGGAGDVPSAGRRCWWAGGLLALGCAGLALAPTVGAAGALAVLVAVVVLLTLAEMLWSAAAWTISYGLAPADRRSSHLGVFALGPVGQQIAGPPLLTVGVLALGRAGWVLLGVAFVIAGLLVERVTRTAGTALAVSGGD